jgi:hypothetical protein
MEYKILMPIKKVIRIVSFAILPNIVSEIADTCHSATSLIRKSKTKQWGTKFNIVIVDILYTVACMHNAKTNSACVYVLRVPNNANNM